MFSAGRSSTVESWSTQEAQAKQCGARVEQGSTDMPFGERQYTAQDHTGHWWTFAQHIADIAPEEWGAIEAKTQ